jgi:hypothetical protein
MCLQDVGGYRVLDSSGRDAQSMMRRSLELMRSALQILDEAKAPANVGACLDLAICRLEAELDEGLHYLKSDRSLQ